VASARQVKKGRLEFVDANLECESFAQLTLREFMSTRSTFRDCRFERMTIKRACFGGGTVASEYVDCVFDGSRINATTPGTARFLRCSFREVHIQDFFGLTCGFVDCVFSGTIEKAVFQSKLLGPHRDRFGRSENDFRGNDFSGAKLGDVAFRGGIDLTSQNLPSGPEFIYLPDAALAVARGWRFAVGMSDLDLRSRTLAFLRSLERDIEGQEQLFISLIGIDRRQREAIEAISEVLRGLGE
jgi:hypothetical protein